MDKVKWIFELLDKASAPAKAIAQALDKVTASSDKTIAAVTRTEKAVAKTQATLSKTSGRTFLQDFSKEMERLLDFDSKSSAGWNIVSAIKSMGSGLMEVVKWAGLAGVAVGGILTGFGVALVRAQGFKETTLTSLKLILNDGKAAQEVYDDAVSIAQKTPFDTQDVLGGMKKLLAIGFDRKDARFALQALGDVASAHQNPGQALDLMTLGLSQIKGFGKLRTQELNQVLGQASYAGISVLDIYDTIGKKLGKKASDIPKIMEQGLIDGDTGVWAIMKTFTDKVSHGVAGSTMVAQSNTLMGLISNLKSKPFELLSALEVTPGMESFKRFMKTLSDALDPTTAAGKKTADVLSRIGNELFSAFGDLANPERMQELIAGISDGLLIGWDAIKTVGTGLKDVFEIAWPPAKRLLDKLSSEEGKQALRSFAAIAELAFVSLGQAIAGTIGLVEQLLSIFTRTFNTMSAMMKGNGETLVGGLIAGVTGGLPGLAKFMTNDFSGTVVDGVKSPEGLDIHSPSRKFMELGEYSRLGFEQGLSGIDTASAIQARAPSSTGGRTGFTVSFASGAISIDARGGDGADIARKVAEILPGELAAAFEAMAIEGGVA